MKKYFASIKTDKRGTALLTALLIMGVLMAVSMALSSLIFRETRLVGDLIDSGRAYYAAESGIEEALYYLNKELPGWEKDGLGEVGERAIFEYKLKNKCKSYPCFDLADYNLENAPLDKMYEVLELNENITIPLFTVDEEGEIKSVKDFTVMFFAPFNVNEALIFDGSEVSGWDILRWKIFGMKKMETGEGTEFKTESISDFTAISTLQNINTGEESATSAAQPSWFGTRECREENGIICESYPTHSMKAAETFGGEIQVCSQTDARDFYIYEDGEYSSTTPCYPISQFMEEHQAGQNASGINYLSLTNMINPEYFKYDYLKKFDIDRLDAAKIFFRVETDEDIVREVADITADGYSGNSKQSINVKIRRGGYMPVFNFSIYSTHKTEEDKDTYGW